VHDPETGPALVVANLHVEEVFAGREPE